MENFLTCLPNVFVVRDTYQIVINVRERGICRLLCDGAEYYEDSYGLYPTETLVHKFSVPQKNMDEAGGYTILFRAVPDRRAYSSQAGETQEATFRFYPVTRTENVRAVYLADVHGQYASAERAVAAFGDRPDFLIVNGDLGEVESEASLLDMNAFIGRVSGGEIPVIYGRGNHDARGKLAERLPWHTGTDGNKTYFPYRFGPVCGVVIDCGEDKLDSNVEYGGVNCFEHYRRCEARDLSHTKLPDLPYRIVVSHVPFMADSAMWGPFDIMPETYASLSRSLSRMHPDLFIAGHTHHFEYYPAGTADGCKDYHNFPVVVASRVDQDGFACTGFILNPNKIEFYHLSGNGTVLDSFRLPIRR